MSKDRYVDLKSKNLEFIRNGMLCKIEVLKRSDMSVDIVCYKDNEFYKRDNIPFAQLTKKLKKSINIK